MIKLYLPVSPSYFEDETVFPNLFNCIVATFAYLLTSFLYERVCGYPITNDKKFYNNLEECKRDSHLQRDAILELEVKHNKITAVCAIHENENFEEGCFFGNKKAWYRARVNMKDVTPGALDKINQNFHNSPQYPERSKVSPECGMM